MLPDSELNKLPLLLYEQAIRPKCTSAEVGLTFASGLFGRQSYFVELSTGSSP